MLTTAKTQKLLTYKIEIEKALFELKDFFKKSLCKNLQLMEVNAPLILKSGTGINDDLNGVEKPVSFIAKSFPGCKLEIVQSLAKWKRLKLADLEMPADMGIVTDMKALRPDEIISPIHSVLVDQWDWEKRITTKERSISYLKSVVQNIYRSIKETEKHLAALFPFSEVFLPEKITFIHSEELQYRYSKLTPRSERK